MRVRIRRISLAGYFAAALTMFIPLPAFAQLPSATVKIWPTNSFLGANPDATVADVAALTVDVATAANPLSIGTVWENTTCPGGPCGGMLWNPATNDFECWGVTTGFTSSTDLNRKAPVLTSADGKTFQPGDLWVGGPNGAPVYVKFKGLASIRIWSPVGSVWAVFVDQSTGNVWFSSPFDGSINRLNPATNTHTKWVVGGQPRQLAQDSSGRIYVTAGDHGVVRLDPATNSIRRWPVGGLFTGTSTFSTPDGIVLDPDGNVWATESVASKIGRLNPTTTVLTEYTKSGLSNPQLLATSGSGSLLQLFFTEGSGTAASVLTQVEAVGTSTTLTPVDSTVTPTTVTLSPSDRGLSFRRVTITPSTFTIPGVDGGPDALGITKTAAGERIPGILRFPLGGLSVGGALTSFASGMTNVALPNTIFGSFLFSSQVFEVTSGAIIAPPSAPKDSAPVAQCKNVTATADATCHATASVNNGSFDPDGDKISLVQSPAGPFGLGSTTVKLTATDPAGLSSMCSATVTVVDKTPPVITCPAPKTVECTSPAGASVTETATATDNCSVASVGCSPGSGTFALGSTAVTCTATDGSANTSSCATTVKVVDTTPPTVTCVKSVNPSGKNVPTAGANPKSGQDPAGFYKVSATDICTLPAAIKISIGSFTLSNGETIKITQTPGMTGVSLVNTMGPLQIKHFQVGPGDAVIKATDGSGNMATVTCLVPPPPK